MHFLRWVSGLEKSATTGGYPSPKFQTARHRERHNRVLAYPKPSAAACLLFISAIVIRSMMCWHPFTTIERVGLVDIRNNSVVIYSFFSGAGLLDLGLKKAGFTIGLVNEIDSDAISAYKLIHGVTTHLPDCIFHNVDVTRFLDDCFWSSTVHPADHQSVGFVGGPPCPDFSVAGKNVGAAGDRGKLTKTYFSLIEKRKPDFFIFENVKGLYQTAKHRQFYEVEKERLRKAGYFLFDSIENALSFGAPQYRDRLILIGLKHSYYGENVCRQFGLSSHRLYSLQGVLEMPWPSKSPFSPNGKVPCPPGIRRELTVEHWFRKNDVVNHRNSHDYFKPHATDRFMTIAEGDTHGKSFKRLHRWRYSPTAAYGNNEVHLHPYLPRRLSVAEAMAIQSMPKESVLPKEITLSKKFKLIGNGVPVLLAKGIGLALKDVICGD